MGYSPSGAWGTRTRLRPDFDVRQVRYDRQDFAHHSTLGLKAQSAFGPLTELPSKLTSALNPVSSKYG